MSERGIGDSDLLHDLSIAYLLLGALYAIVIAVDVARHSQHMSIMDVVWPVTALFGRVWILWQYFIFGRLASHEAMIRGKDQRQRRATPFPLMVAKWRPAPRQRVHVGDIVAE